MKKHEDTIKTYTYYVKSIKEAHPELAYLHLVEGRVAGIADVEEKEDEKLDFLVSN